MMILSERVSSLPRWDMVCDGPVELSRCEAI